MNTTPESALRTKAEQIIEARKALSTPISDEEDYPPFVVNHLTLQEFEERVVRHVVRKIVS
jgi:hypothetical protein